MEFSKKRLERFIKAVNAIVLHSPKYSFIDLIEANRDIFMDFKCMYSTNVLEKKIANISLSTIEKECSVVKKYFYENGLLFYTDEIYKESKIGEAKFSIDYSLSFDSNIIEAFRIWVKGGNLGNNISKFENLVKYIKNKENTNYDFTFFMIENYNESLKIENNRPFFSVRALKLFKSLIYDKNFDINKPKFSESLDSAGKSAINTIYNLNQNPVAKEYQKDRLLVYVVLLKAVIINLNKQVSNEQKLNLLAKFCLSNIGKFPKTEIYFAWKLFKIGKNLNFFNSIFQVNSNIIKNIRSMSWDLYAQRWQERLTTSKNLFFIPFFVSFDNRFVDLLKVSPIKAVLIDEKNERSNTIRLDEYEFNIDLNNSIDNNVRSLLNDKSLVLKRQKKKISLEELSKLIKILEKKLLDL